MTRLSSKYWMFAVVVVLTILMGLLMLSGNPSLAQDPATPTPDPNDVTTSEPFEATFGSGPFNLMLPEAGLESLTSYRATLILGFEGTVAGEAAAWSRTYTMLVTEAGRQVTIEKVDDGTTENVYMAETNGTFYEQRGENSCLANVVEIEGDFAATWEPASFLDSVIGADEAGTETVSDIETNHYTFDEMAQGAAEIADATGELWVAADGGYLVKYLLVTTGGADYFGEGIEGTLSWDYALDEINQPLALEIPADCPAGLLDVPVMADAAELVEMPGFTSYTTPAGLADVIAFYEEQVTTLGGEAANSPTISENTGLYGFTLTDQPILLIVTSDGLNDTSVALYGMSDSSELAFAAEVPDERGPDAEVEATPAIGVTPADGGSTVEGCIPVLADAANVQNFPGTVMYTTSTNVEEATIFYEEQLTAAGSQVSSMMPATDAMAMLQATQGTETLMIMIASAGGMNTVTVSSMSAGNLTLCEQ